MTNWRAAMCRSGPHAGRMPGDLLAHLGHVVDHQLRPGARRSSRRRRGGPRHAGASGAPTAEARPSACRASGRRRLEPGAVAAERARSARDRCRRRRHRPRDGPERRRPARDCRCRRGRPARACRRARGWRRAPRPRRRSRRRCAGGRLATGSSKWRLEEGSQRPSLSRVDRQPGRHRMAAALLDEARLGRLAHGRTHVDAGDRAPRAPAALRRRGETQGEARQAEPLLQPRGHQTQDARMPVLARHHDAPATSLPGRAPSRPGPWPTSMTLSSISWRSRLSAIEVGGERHRFAAVVAEQKPQRGIRVADAAGGIEARSQHDIPAHDSRAGASAARYRRALPARCAAGCRAPSGPARHRPGSVPGAARRRRPCRAPLGRGIARRSGSGLAVAVPALLAEQAVGYGDQRHGHAGSTEETQAGKVVLAVGIDDRQSPRENLPAPGDGRRSPCRDRGRRRAAADRAPSPRNRR